MVVGAYAVALIIFNVGLHCSRGLFMAALVAGVFGLILGFAINFATTYVSAQLFFPTAFIALLVILLLKPGGLFGSKKVRNA